MGKALQRMDRYFYLSRLSVSGARHLSQLIQNLLKNPFIGEADQAVAIFYHVLHFSRQQSLSKENPRAVREHHMHSEFYQLDEQAAEIINETKRKGGRVICVGTTSCRTVESVAARIEAESWQNGSSRRAVIFSIHSLITVFIL